MKIGQAIHEENYRIYQNNKDSIIKKKIQQYKTCGPVLYYYQLIIIQLPTRQRAKNDWITSETPPTFIVRGKEM